MLRGSVLLTGQAFMTLSLLVSLDYIAVNTMWCPSSFP